MEFKSKIFLNLVTLMAVGSFGTACTTVPVTIPSAKGSVREVAASKSTTSFGQPAPVVAQAKDGTAFYPTSDAALGQARSTLVPPKQTIPVYQTAAVETGAGTTGTAAPVLLQLGSKPSRGYQSGRSNSEERNSFDGVDVASVTDTGSNNNDSAGGGGNTTTSAPESASNRSSGGGSSSAARSNR